MLMCLVSYICSKLVPSMVEGCGRFAANVKVIHFIVNGSTISLICLWRIHNHNLTQNFGTTKVDCCWVMTPC